MIVSPLGTAKFRTPSPSMSIGRGRVVGELGGNNEVYTSQINRRRRFGTANGWWRSRCANRRRRYESLDCRGQGNFQTPTIVNLGRWRSKGGAMEHPGIPGEGPHLKMPSSGGKLGLGGRSSGGCRLSMVGAPNERIGALVVESARQRFNVAASRAQYQLWLFYSATLDVLSPTCMRRRLLSYMLNPGSYRIMGERDESYA
jgi:hypothetical protein